MRVRDPLTIYIDFARLMVERDRRIQRSIRMPIEIKGLAVGVQAARRGIADARASVAGMQEAGMALKSTVDDVTAALKAAEADIRFEAVQLGNGGEASSDPSSKPAPKPVPVAVADVASDPQVSSFRSSTG